MHLSETKRRLFLDLPSADIERSPAAVKGGGHSVEDESSLEVRRVSAHNDC